MALTTRELDGVGKMRRFLAMLHPVVTGKAIDVAPCNMDAVEPCHVPSFCRGLDVTLTTSLFGSVSVACHGLAVAFNTTGSRLQKRLVSEIDFADFHLFSLLPVAYCTVLVVLGRGGKKMAQSAHVLVNVHVGAALDNRIVAGGTAQGFPSLLLLHVLKVIERCPLKIDYLYGLGPVAHLALFVLHPRFEGEPVSPREIANG